ncbi:MAG: 4Fe-4S binding protein [Spirochaetes bacterium]|nr:4Fe-4S binding protein [Spirochaetota bacterium]
MKNYSNETARNSNRNSIITAFTIWIIFLSMGAFWYFKTGRRFFIFDLPYIGSSIALGILLGAVLPKRFKHYGRRVTQLLVGIYMLCILGFVMKVNMQIESFFFYALAGAIGGAIIHYLPAKLLGPAVFSRGFCGWACWTAMVLDFLPWKTPRNGRYKYLGIIRYIHFILSFILVAFLFFTLSYFPDNGTIEVLAWLSAGNVFYYSAAVLLAYLFRDNRAFCKYLCPIPVLQKITARFSVFKIKIDLSKCIDCGLCERKCPMNIRLLEYSHAGKRILSTECILCNICVEVCPKHAVDISSGFDFGFQEYINFKKRQ